MNSNPVFWEHGVFLQPQHFQLEYIQSNQRLASTLALINPWLWGIRRLEINKNSIFDGVFEISSLELLLPSGEWVSFPGNGWILPRSFEKLWVNSEAPLSVSLGLAELSESRANAARVSAPEELSENLRYGAPLQPDSVPDYFGDGPDMEVSTLRYNLRICFGDEGGSLWKMPLARLIHQNGRVVLDEKCVPPCVDIFASETLRRIVRDVLDRLLSRSRYLDGYKIVSNGGSWQGAQGYETMLFSVLGLLGRNIPDLNHFLTAPSAHPWNVYGLLCRLVGELSVFSPNLSPLGEMRDGVKALPDYDHCDLFNCFDSASRIILRLVDSLVMGPQFVFDLDRDSVSGTVDGRFSAAIPQNAFSGGNYEYWLLLRSQNAKNLAVSASALGKLTPSSQANDIVSQALPGIRVRASSTPPAGLPKRGDTVYFRVDTADPLWQQLTDDGKISYTLSGAPDDLVVQMVVIER